MNFAFQTDTNLGDFINLLIVKSGYKRTNSGAQPILSGLENRPIEACSAESVGERTKRKWRTGPLTEAGSAVPSSLEVASSSWGPSHWWELPENSPQAPCHSASCVFLCCSFLNTFLLVNFWWRKLHISPSFYWKMMKLMFRELAQLVSEYQRQSWSKVLLILLPIAF